MLDCMEIFEKKEGGMRGQGKEDKSRRIGG